MSKWQVDILLPILTVKNKTGKFNGGSGENIRIAFELLAGCINMVFS